MRGITKRDQIQEWVRRDIAEHRYGLGQRLPYGVKEICERFDVSTATAVYAVKALHDEGVLEVRASIGYFGLGSVPNSTPQRTELEAAIENLDRAHEQLLAARRRLQSALERGDD